MRLTEYIEKMRLVPFKRGVHDCALFAGNCIDIETGLDTTSEFRKPYGTKKAAYELLKKMGYDGLAAVANAKLGEALPSPFYAGRGDCVLIEYEGEEALGIVDMTGRRAVTVGKDGLKFYDMKYWSKGWSV